MDKRLASGPFFRLMCRNIGCVEEKKPHNDSFLKRFHFGILLAISRRQEEHLPFAHMPEGDKRGGRSR
ncbi:hypothetical protein AA984_26195 [Brevibacillus formosus]|uniref:Uncharacterized protein n=1 Tax=Brevibacillus formosus TaxID=54913 RepID=A0A837KEN6_9BACL|nr:hypothetical protein AA984_26195 [Brevibacillus formosus]PSJ90971.1 hypothetical protein C7R91_25740 [Brevibacillus formosus]